MTLILWRVFRCRWLTRLRHAPEAPPLVFDPRSSSESVLLEGKRRADGRDALSVGLTGSPLMHSACKPHGRKYYRRGRSPGPTSSEGNNRQTCSSLLICSCSFSDRSASNPARHSMLAAAASSS